MTPTKRVAILWTLVLALFGLFSAVYWAAMVMVAPAEEPEGHPVTAYGLIGAGAFVITLVLVPLCRRLAGGLGVVDQPDQDRKIHGQSVPYLGGLAFYAAFLAALAYLAVAHPEYNRELFYPMALIGTIIVMMGIYDDVRDMRNTIKLTVELALIAILYLWGFRTAEIANPFTDGTLYVGWLALFITPIWIAGVMNAINFSDGLDGLAAGLVFVCAASVFAIGIMHKQVISCLIMAYLMGTTLAFLRYNFHPASIFMGDTGALFLGFVLGTTTLFVRQKGVAAIALSVPVVVMAVPILDTVLSMWRRMRRAGIGGFFLADRDHLHHRLLNLGLSQPKVVLSLYYISMCMGLMAFIFSVTPPPYNFLIHVLALLFIIFGIVVLKFVEGRSADKE